MPAVVDTNVLITANRRNRVPLECAAACAKVLDEITKIGLLVLDQEGLIFDEYMRHLSFSGQPGAGDAFFKWLADHRYRPGRVSHVHLAGDARHGEFVAFPNDPALAKFDRSDRKFVAASLAHPESPPILNATDRDWWDFREVLRSHGITVRFICGEDRFQRQ